MASSYSKKFDSEVVCCTSINLAYITPDTTPTGIMK